MSTNGAEQPLDSMAWPEQYDGIHKRSTFSRRRTSAMPELAEKSDNYLGMNGYSTLAEIQEKAAELAPGVPAHEILINFWQMRWTTDATPEEIAEREETKARSAANREKWERETLARLQAKYGVPESAGSVLPQTHEQEQS